MIVVVVILLTKYLLPLYGRFVASSAGLGEPPELVVHRSHHWTKRDLASSIIKSPSLGLFKQTIIQYVKTNPNPTPRRFLCVPVRRCCARVSPAIHQPLLLSGLSSFALRVQKRGCAVASRLSRALGRQSVTTALAAAAAEAPLCDGVLDHGAAAAIPSTMAMGGAGAGAITSPGAKPPPVARLAAAGDGQVGAAATAAALGCPISGEMAQGCGLMVAAAAAVVVEQEDVGGDVRRVWQGDSSQSDCADTKGSRRRQSEAVEEEEEDDSLAEHYDPAM